MLKLVWKCGTRSTILFICNTFCCRLILLSSLYIESALVCCMNQNNVHCFGTIFPNLNFVFASICAARPVHTCIQSDQYRNCSTVINVTTGDRCSRHSSWWGATKNSAVALSLQNNMISIHQRRTRTNEGKTTLILSRLRTVSWMVSSFSASCSWRPLDWRIRHSHLASTLFHSLVLWWRPQRIRPQITRLSQLENSAMGTWPIYKNSIIPDWIEKWRNIKFWYMCSLCSSSELWCVSLIDDAQNMPKQLWAPGRFTKNTSYNWSKQKKPFIW